MADLGFGKGGFMRMCTVATMPPLRIDTMSAAVLMDSNCRETVKYFC